MNDEEQYERIRARDAVIGDEFYGRMLTWEVIKTQPEKGNNDMKFRVTLTTPKGALNNGDQVTLRKQPDNAYDDEAIEVLIGTEPVGYVAAYYKIRKPGTISAGRLVDKMLADTAAAVVVDDQIAEVEV